MLSPLCLWRPSRFAFRVPSGAISWLRAPGFSQDIATVTQASNGDSGFGRLNPAKPTSEPP